MTPYKHKSNFTSALLVRLSASLRFISSETASLRLTSAQADHGPQAVSLPHDDGGQDLASQQAVLDAVGEGVESLVAQHGDLVVHGAAAHRELRRKDGNA